MRKSSDHSQALAQSLAHSAIGRGLVRGSTLWTRAVVVALALALAVVIAPSTGLTQTLDQLRTQGQAGERFDGYLVPRGNVSAQVRAFIADTNVKRQAIYQKRAAGQGVDIAQVGKIYARQIIEGAPAGTWFLGENGTWTRK